MSLSRLSSPPRRALGLACGLGFAMVGADCDGDVVNDPTFQDWCGQSLCQWHTDYGKVTPVPTWSAEDLGVSFADDQGGDPTGTEISQVTQESGARCLLFTSVANLVPSAELTLSLDFDNDGTFEVSQTIASATWERVQTEITAPPAYQGITFRLTKKGTGTAVLAEMRIQETTGCTAPATSVTDLLLGEACSSAAQCASGLVCPEAGDAGIAVCSQCDDDTACAGGAACQRRSVFLPAQCGPGQGLGASGAPCLAASDCQSGTCDGATPVALLSDAGPCNLGAISPSNPSDCSWYEARGGKCQ